MRYFGILGYFGIFGIFGYFGIFGIFVIFWIFGIFGHRPPWCKKRDRGGGGVEGITFSRNLDILTEKLTPRPQNAKSKIFGIYFFFLLQLFLDGMSIMRVRNSILKTPLHTNTN